MSKRNLSRSTESQRNNIEKSPDRCALDDLTPAGRKFALWLAEQFDETGEWPTRVNSRAYCYDNNIDYDEASRDASAIEDVYETPDPRSHGVKLWVLFDAKKCKDAFTTAEQIFMGCFTELRKRLADCHISAVEIARRFKLSADGKTLKHLHHIFRRSRLNMNDQKTTWEVVISVGYLKRPHATFAETFLERPLRPMRFVEATDSSPGRHFIDGSGPWTTENTPSGRKLTDWVFVGSTWKDLGEAYRPKVLEALLSQRMLPLGMEHWTAVSAPTLETSLNVLAQANLALFILGRRYGSLAKPDDPLGRSFTEFEYDTATKDRRIPVLAFVSDESLECGPDALDHANWSRQEAFRKRVQDERTIRRFRSPDSLKSEVIAALVAWEREHQT